QLELALSTTYWPQAWPSPKPVTLEVLTGKDTKLSLPVRTPQPETDAAISFGKPESAPVMEREILRSENRTRQVIHETITNQWKLEDYSDEGERRLPHNGIKHGSKNKNIYSIES